MENYIRAGALVHFFPRKIDRINRATIHVFLNDNASCPNNNRQVICHSCRHWIAINGIVCVKPLLCRELVRIWYLPWLFMSLYEQLCSDFDNERMTTFPIQFRLWRNDLQVTCAIKAIITPWCLQVNLVVWHRKSIRQRIIILYRVKQPLINGWMWLKYQRDIGVFCENIWYVLFENRNLSPMSAFLHANIACTNTYPVLLHIQSVDMEGYQNFSHRRSVMHVHKITVA